MQKSLAPLFFTAAGVVFAGTVGYLIVEGTKPQPRTEFVSSPSAEKTDKPNVSTEESEVKTEVEVSNLANQPESESKITEDAPNPIINSDDAVIRKGEPIFDILRVEKDGSAVIAGKAQAGSEVEIVNAANNNEVVGRAKALESGDYAIVLDKPLGEGKHELYIVSRTKDGKVVQSSDAGLIEIPKAGSDAEPVVIVSNPEKPTRVLQNETVEVASLPKSETVESVEESASEPEETANVETQSTETEEVGEGDNASEEIKSDAVITSAGTPVLIEAADVENNRVFIAGKGEAGSNINMYIEDKFIGTAKVADNGAFLFEGKIALKPGKYPVRADVVDSKTAKVVSRAEVTLVHQPNVDIASAAITAEPVDGATTELAQPADNTSAEDTTEQSEETATVETSEPEIANAEENQVSDQASVETPTVNDTQNTEIASQENNQENSEETQDGVQEIRSGASVIIRRGDSLWVVARRNYGEGVRFTTIFDANRDQVRDPNLIYPGQVLKVPENQEAQPEANEG